MMKKTVALIIATILLMTLAGCKEYQEENFVGKTSTQIMAEYGEFDCVGKPADADGLYRNTSCGYTVRESRIGFLETDPEVLFFVLFDENGIAVSCKEGYRPGG